MSLMNRCLTRLIEGTVRETRTLPRYGTQSWAVARYCSLETE